MLPVISPSHFIKGAGPHLYTEKEKKQKGQHFNMYHQCQQTGIDDALIFLHVIYCPYHRTAQRPVLEEPIDLFSLGVQVNIIETRPGGQTRDRGHLGLKKEAAIIANMKLLH